MQQRRYRPGDVLDDYCPRERRITDHAIVAMIDDHIKQTRCCVCDAEHEYKDGKVPPQRRKKAQAALFTQVLDGLQGPQPAARLPHQPDTEPEADASPDSSQPIAPVPIAIVRAQDPGNGHAGNGHNVRANQATPPPQYPPVAAEVVPDVAAAVLHAEANADDDARPKLEDGPVRRPLIRATLPRPEGQPAQPTRVMPDFTIRQPNNGRGGHRPAGPAGRRRGHQAGQGAPPGPMRFGRTDRGHGQGDGQGQGPRQHGGRNHGPSGGRPAGPRRGGKKR
jgi:hypothetical protein